MEIYKEFRIEAAHRLPNVPAGHKCARLHGHSYRVQVWVEGAVDPEQGWVVDFATIGDAFQPVSDALDHNYLNEVEGLENPTSEAIARWIWERLHPRLPRLRRITVHETSTSGCVYEGPDGPGPRAQRTEQA